MGLLANALGVATPKEAMEKILKVAGIVAGMILLAYIVTKIFNLQSSATINVLGVRTDFSVWSLAMVLIFWVDGNLYIRKHHLGLADRGYAVAALVVSVSVVLSVVAHEFAHGLVSQGLFNNPIDHAGISFWGAYVSPTGSIFEMAPLAEAFVAFAGPLTNLLIGFVALGIVWRHGESLFENSVQYIGVVNFRLAKVNLIPFLIVLDGGKVLHGLVRFAKIDSLVNMDSILVQSIIGLGIYLVYRALSKDKESIEERMADL